VSTHETVTFSFGENWQRFLGDLHPAAISAMSRYFADWLPEGVRDLQLVDVGSGSGLSSLVAWHMGAADVTSFDVDPASVAATTVLWERAGRPTNWSVLSGSILDPSFQHGLGTSDVVLAWGVLHHTGALWEALARTAELVAPNGILWIALYRRGPRYARDLALKRAYNRAPAWGRRVMRGSWAGLKIGRMFVRGDVTLSRIRHYHDNRGMSWWRDIEDWLGGLPYEVASPAEVHAFLFPRGFVLERIDAGQGDGGNDVYRYKRRSFGATEDR